MTGPAYTADQIRAAEAPLLARGVPLMRRAATALAREVASRFPPGAAVLTLAGSGDNGGDALYGSAELAAQGRRVMIVRTGGRVHEAAHAAALSAGAAEAAADDVAGLTRSCAVVLDGILGIGGPPGPRALRGTARWVVERVLTALEDRPRPLVVAVDLPSGLSPDDGRTADGIILPADVTVTFGAVKAGLLLGDGPRLSGEVVLVDIGLDLTGIAPAVPGPG